MNMQQFLDRILGANQGQPQQFNWQGPNSAPINRLVDQQNPAASPAMLPKVLPPDDPWAGMRETGTDAVTTGYAAPGISSPTPRPSSRSGGSILSGLSDLFGGGGNKARGETIEWLMRKGYDEGTATALASNKPLMQQILIDHVKGNKPSEFDQRAQAAQQYGLDPNSEEGRAFVLSGSLQDDEDGYDFVTGRDGSIFRTDKRGGSIEQVYGGKPDQPTSVDEYNFYVGQETAAGRQPDPYNTWKQSQSRAGASQVNIDQKAEGAFDKKLAEKQAETFDAMSTEGMNAKADIAIIGELDGLLEGQGGTLSGVSGYLAQYGIGGEGISDIQAAQALINKLVPTQRQPGSGTMSDRDVELFTRSLPSLWNTPGGNRIILDTMHGLAQYKQAQGEIADMVLAGEITRQEARRMLRALPNPLADFSRNTRKAPALPPPPTAAGPASRRPSPERFGMDPDTSKAGRVTVPAAPAEPGVIDWKDWIRNR